MDQLYRTFIAPISLALFVTALSLERALPCDRRHCEVPDAVLDMGLCAKA